MHQQFGRSHYARRTYYSAERFISWHHQIDEVMASDATRVLEVGKGVGLLAYLASAAGIQVTTYDVSPSLSPDVLGSVSDLPFQDREWDMVVCCEVLEHLPYDVAQRSLCEICRVTKRYVLISVPDVTPFYKVDLALPFFPSLQFSFSRRRLHSLPGIPPNPSHYWELGRGHYSTNWFLESIEDADMLCVKHFRPFAQPYHHFFLLKKEQQSQIDVD